MHELKRMGSKGFGVRRTSEALDLFNYGITKLIKIIPLLQSTWLC